MTAMTIPRLSVTGPGAAGLVSLFESAVHNLCVTNTVPNVPGGPGATIFRAGGGYPTPWTRDSSVNSWFAGSIIDPETATNTLLGVTQIHQGERVLAQDNQWWDQAIWIIAAWHHYLATGSRPFLSEARLIAERSLAILRESHFSSEMGLYLGPAFMQDGISGLPTPPNDPTLQSSFVLDYPMASGIATLSTNAIYVGAFVSLAGMQRELGEDSTSASSEAGRLTRQMRQHFLDADSVAHFVFLDPTLGIRRDWSLEAAGVAFAVMFGVLSKDEGLDQLAGLWREPAGVVNVWPHFSDRYNDRRPGRHNVLCWPVVMGLVNLAAISANSSELFHRGFSDLSALFHGSGGSFFETYNARTGGVDGGWQIGRRWESEPDQTWSATAFLASVIHGVLGVEIGPAGISIRPSLPAGIETLRVENLRYREAVVDIRVTRGLTDSGSPKHAFLDADAMGEHTIKLIASTA